MIEPDFVPLQATKNHWGITSQETDPAVEPVLLRQTFKKGSAWLGGQRMFGSWSHFRLVHWGKSRNNYVRYIHVYQWYLRKNKIYHDISMSMILTNKIKGFKRIRYYWVLYIIVVPRPSKCLENSGNILYQLSWGLVAILMAWRVYVGISLCWHLGLWPFLQFQDYDPLGRGGYLQVLITHCMTPWINASIFLVGGYNPTTLAWQLETLVFRRAVLFSGHGHRIASPVDHWMGQELQVLPDHEVTKSALPARGTAWRCKRMVWVFQRPVFWCSGCKFATIFDDFVTL